MTRSSNDVQHQKTSPLSMTISPPFVHRRTLPDFAALTRQPLRWLLPWMIVWVLCGVALASWSVLRARVDLVGRMSAPVALVRAEIAVERAFSGRGPDPARLAMLRSPQPRNGRPGSAPPLLQDETTLRVDGASFHLDIAALGTPSQVASRLTGMVSWRHVQPAGGATRFWICGHALPPAGAILSEPQNLTNVAPELLPSTCRANP